MCGDCGQAWDKIELLCETADDAVGECFDKVAKMLGLPYPGGVQIEKLALEHTCRGPITFVHNPCKKDGFSYSGLKTAVLTYINKEKQSGRELDIPHICASFQREAIMQLVDKCVAELKKAKIKTLCVCGGVSANGYLRKRMQAECSDIGVQVFFPEMQYCTDNAAMIGAAAVLGVKI